MTLSLTAHDLRSGANGAPVCMGRENTVLETCELAYHRSRPLENDVASTAPIDGRMSGPVQCGFKKLLMGPARVSASKRWRSRQKKKHPS